VELDGWHCAGLVVRRGCVDAPEFGDLGSNLVPSAVAEVKEEEIGGL